MREKDTAQQAARWLQIFQEQARSGQTVEQWCKEHHISSKTYYRWKNVLRERLQAQEGAASGKGRQGSLSIAGAASPRFAKLTHPEPTRKGTVSSIATLTDRPQAILLRIGEAELEIPAGIESRHLEMVLKAVQNVW